MPWIENTLPFSGSVQQSRHASRAGAQVAAAKATSQLIRYLQALKARPHGLTDLEAETVLGIPRSSINARRRVLVKAELVYSDGFRHGPSGVKNTIWKAP